MTDLEFKELWALDDGYGRLKIAYSPKSGGIWPAGTDIRNIVAIENAREQAEAELKKKKAAAAAKAWSSAQASAGAKAELAQFKAAQAYQKAQEELEEAQKAKAAAAAKAWSQSQDIDAINAKTSEIRRQTAMINADAAAAAAKSYSAADQQQVINEANAAQENAAMNENLPVLPEVEVKSDFGKYLLIGGAALAIFYFMSKKKRG